MKKILKNRLFYIAICCFLSIVFVATSGFLKFDTVKRFGTNYSIEKAKIIETDNTMLQPDPYIKGMFIGRQPVVLEILTGNHKGEKYEVMNMLSRSFNIFAKEGKTVICNIRVNEYDVVDGVDIYGHNRDGMIITLALLFVALLILVGGQKGFYSVFSLTFTLIVIIFFMIPLIIKGYNPILLASITAILTTTLVLFIVSGVNEKSISAIIGIIGGLVVAGIVSYVAGYYGSISGINMENSEEIISLTYDTPIRVPELLFAGIIISSLGAIMDVGMSISSAIFEIKEANNRLNSKQLFKSGINIGRDIMGTMSNTLILAFAGSSISLMIIIYLYNIEYLRLINLDILDIEIIQGLSGSIGLILTIPITAYVASKLATIENKKSSKGEKKARK